MPRGRHDNNVYSTNPGDTTPGLFDYSNENPYSRYSYQSAQPGGQGQPYANASGPQYGGSQYGGSQYPVPNMAPSPKKSTGRKVAIVIVSILVAVIVAAIAVTLVYFHKLDSNLEKQEYQQGNAEGALVDAPANEPFYLLVLGSDSRSGAGSGGVQFSDVIMLIRMDIPNKQFTIVSIPRDTRWTLDDGTVVKLNSVYNEGVSESVEAVSTLTGVPIAHYAEVDITDLENIVNAVGGVQVNVPTALSVTSMVDGSTIHLEEGLQTLNGVQAQAFVRARHELETGDVGRQSHVREVVQAVLDKIAKYPRTELPGLLLDLSEYMHTDMRSGDFAAMGLSYLLSPASSTTMYNVTGPSGGGIDEWYDDGWYCFDNPEGWATLMAVVDAGGDPSNIDVESMAITHEQRAIEAGLAEDDD